ncbi:phytanoyl-CoA dioxygenase [Hysterangium stoloniferum]|nr:phytanoyl-CoA dioxygenase [Hysterangium stoloniferum]
MSITPAPRTMEYLNEEQVAKFRRDGYLCLRGFLDPEQTGALLSRSKQLLNGFDLASHPRTRFTAGEEGEHVGDDYFLSSGDKIRFFFEEDAVNQDGSLNRPKEEAVNKIGHGLHELDPVFRAVTLENDKLKSLARDLNFHEDPRVLQSMVICKQRKVGGEGQHDLVFFARNQANRPQNIFGTFTLYVIAVAWYKPVQYTDPPTALGFWFALEKCTPHNGALSFLPGSHLTAPITKRFVRAPGGGTTFEPLESNNSLKPEGEYILEPCEPGDLVLIHGSVLHKSERNTSPLTRFAYTFHMIEDPAKATYDEKNWLQPSTGMPFSRLYANT